MTAADAIEVLFHLKTGIIGTATGRHEHPTNGLALCKNHHWAFDQRVIAPDADGIWRVSRHLEPRRSRGEKELARLAGQRLLAPSEPAFAPKPEYLAWRYQRLLN